VKIPCPITGNVRFGQSAAFYNFQSPSGGEKQKMKV